MKILFIEDQEQHIYLVLEALPADAEYKICDFESAEAAREEYDPDVVALDILQHGASPEGKPAGVQIHDQIWEKEFCPIIVYSAHPEFISSTNVAHPFISFVKKGRDSAQVFVETLSKFRPHIESKANLKKFLRNEMSNAMKYISPYAFDAYKDDISKCTDAILRSSRRRVAAALDEVLVTSDEGLQSWEQYIYPPFGDNLMLGDVLCLDVENRDNPLNYRIVLTPSCDLACSVGRSAKVSEVLTAKCFPYSTGLKTLNMASRAAAKKNDALRKTLLSTGFSGEVLPIPSLRGVVPHMVAKLRQLELIALEKINSDPKIERIASIDSPFRELISWAYLQISGRPGLPERDFEKWSEEICQALDEDQQAR